MPKNYYIILGIPSYSSQEEVKAAYRKLAKEFHPDRYRQKSSPFLTIQEAYSVLGDPVQRRTYDKVLRDNRQIQEKKQRHAEPMRGYRPETVEPLIPRQKPIGRGDTSLPRSFFASLLSFDSLFDTLSRNIDEHIRPIDEVGKELTVTIALTPGQASKGGHIRLNVPIRLRCSGCNGRGNIGPYQCWKCSGAGLLRGEVPVVVSCPSGILDNQSVRLSLDRYGIHDGYLTVTFRIQSAPFTPDIFRS